MAAAGEHLLADLSQSRAEGRPGLGQDAAGRAALQLEADLARVEAGASPVNKRVIARR